MASVNDDFCENIERKNLTHISTKITIFSPQEKGIQDKLKNMHVINRSGQEEKVSFDKILCRIQKLCYQLHELVDPPTVCKAVINGMYSGIKTSELDELAAQTCAYMTAKHPDFSKLAARISISNLHKNTLKTFHKVIDNLYNYKDEQGRNASLIADDVYDFIMKNKHTLDNAIVYTRDLDYDYFAFKTLERSYLLKINGQIAERPQHMLMRVACGIHCGDVDKVLETYDLMSKRYFTHATPTLFNSGTRKPQMSSCFLLTMKGDSIDGIYETLKQCALISKTAGGIGLSVHCIRATDSYIKGTNGKSNGIVPMLRVFNATARYVDQGGGKRKGSFAIYLEPWHADIFEFLELRKNHGAEEFRARDLFYALWIPDLFMKRVEENGEWSLFCPNECPNLHLCWGKEFEDLYTSYESQGKARAKIKAQSLWFAILESQIETGTPYMLYKDACNRKSNQQNLGTIQSSNLCTEIVQYTSPDEVAVCNLASIALPKYVNTQTRKFDFETLYKITKVVCYNLNQVIDRNYYPVIEAEVSNKRHRPIGIGVQGLADAFILMRLPYDSDEARVINREIFETIYFAAFEASVELAEKLGPYESYPGSPTSKGLFQFDLWNKEYEEKGLPPVTLSGRWDWEELRKKLKLYGVRNSLLIAPMPTASTSQILGNNECFEPYTSNIYCRRVLSGEFLVVNPHLLNDLISANLWNDYYKNLLISENGSIANIPEFPSDLKSLYKTVWEIKQKNVLDMAIDRAPFIDQSQSINIHFVDPNFSKLTSMHFYGWKAGLKTGQYYLRTKPAADAIKFTVDQTFLKSSIPRSTLEVDKDIIHTLDPKKRTDHMYPINPLIPDHSSFMFKKNFIGNCYLNYDKSQPNSYLSDIPPKIIKRDIDSNTFGFDKFPNQHTYNDYNETNSTDMLSNNPTLLDAGYPNEASFDFSSIDKDFPISQTQKKEKILACPLKRNRGYEDDDTTCEACSG